jgi:hypothetical protein
LGTALDEKWCGVRIVSLRLWLTGISLWSLIHISQWPLNKNIPEDPVVTRAKLAVHPFLSSVLRFPGLGFIDLFLTDVSKPEPTMRLRDFRRQVIAHIGTGQIWRACSGVLRGDFEELIFRYPLNAHVSPWVQHQ